MWKHPAIGMPPTMLGLANQRVKRKSYFRWKPGRCYACFFLRSAQRRFIASDNLFLPSGVKPPRLRFFMVVPLGLPTRFLPPPDRVDPSSAEIA